MLLLATFDRYFYRTYLSSVMTLINKHWLKNEALRMFLSGEYQESIRSQLKVSVGTVNSLINEILKSDDTADLQRQIAIVSKKEKVSIKQIAANLRYKNLIKLNMLDEKKSEKFLNALDMMFNKYSIPHTDAASNVFSAIEIMLRENVIPGQLEETIRSKISQLRQEEGQIEAITKTVKETNDKLEAKLKSLKIKDKDLVQFNAVKSMLELYRFPEIAAEYGTVARALVDMKRMGYDPKVIVFNYERFQSVTNAIERMEIRLQESERMLQYYSQKIAEEKARRKDYDNAYEILTRLVKDGLREEDLFAVANILKNDFPQNGIDELKKNLSDYGSIAAALFRMKRDYEARTGSSFEEN